MPAVTTHLPPSHFSRIVDLGFTTEQIQASQAAGIHAPRGTGLEGHNRRRPAGETNPDRPQRPHLPPPGRDPHMLFCEDPDVSSDEFEERLDCEMDNRRGMRITLCELLGLALVVSVVAAFLLHYVHEPAKQHQRKLLAHR